MRLTDIPREKELQIKERIAAILERWSVITDTDDQSVQTPNSSSGTTLETAQIIHEPSISPELQNIEDTMSQSSGADLAEQLSPETYITPASYHQKADHQGTFKVKWPDAIDLTGDDELNLFSGIKGTPEQIASPSESTMTKGPSPKSSGASATSYWSTNNSHTHEGSSETIVLSDDQLDVFTSSSSSPQLVRPSTTRKRSHRSSQASAPTSRLIRQRKRQKTSPRDHLSNEISCISQAIPLIQKMIQTTDEEYELFERKQAQILEDGRIERASIQNRRKDLTKLKEHLVAWGAQDTKVTREWEDSC